MSALAGHSKTLSLCWSKCFHLALTSRQRRALVQLVQVVGLDVQVARRGRDGAVPKPLRQRVQGPAGLQLTTAGLVAKVVKVQVDFVELGLTRDR
jgi:hypothetical protein